MSVASRKCSLSAQLFWEHSMVGGVISLECKVNIIMKKGKKKRNVPWVLRSTAVWWSTQPDQTRTTHSSVTARGSETCLGSRCLAVRFQIFEWLCVHCCAESFILHTCVECAETPQSADLSSNERTWDQMVTLIGYLAIPSWQLRRTFLRRLSC